MTKVVPYDAKGAILRFEAWNRVKNREGAVYAPVPQKTIPTTTQTLKHMLNFHRFWIDWYQESIQNVAQ